MSTQESQRAYAEVMPEKASIPVNGVTIFFGLIGLITAWNIFATGVNYVNDITEKTPDVPTCLTLKIDNEEPWALPSEEKLKFNQDLIHGNKARELADEAASNCLPATCVDDDLEDYKKKIDAYIGWRTTALGRFTIKYGQTGVDYVIDHFTSFTDSTIEKSIHEMAQAKKLPIVWKMRSLGDNKATTFAMLAKYGPSSIKACPLPDRQAAALQ